MTCGTSNAETWELKQSQSGNCALVKSSYDPQWVTGLWIKELRQEENNFRRKCVGHHEKHNDLRTVTAFTYALPAYQPALHTPAECLKPPYTPGMVKHIPRCYTWPKERFALVKLSYRLKTVNNMSDKAADQSEKSAKTMFTPSGATCCSLHECVTMQNHHLGP